MKFLVPRLKPRYGFREWLAAINVFQRRSIEKYEQVFADKFGCEHGIMFSHGRTGLYALMKVWGLDNTEIICPAYTCVVVPNAVVLSGNKPVFVDCEEGSFNMSIQGVEAAITENTRVIVATHLFGYPMDIDAVQAIADKASEQYRHKVYVVQDCAHSYGATWNGRLVTEAGDAAIFGSNVSKIINSVFGGIVTTNSRDTYLKLLSWREKECINKRVVKSLKRVLYFIAVNVAFTPIVYTLVNWLERKGLLDKFVKYYEDGVIDFPGDWDQLPVPIEARIGLAQLKSYEQIIEDRTTWARAIIDSFKENEDVSFIDDMDGATYSHLVGVVEDRVGWVEYYGEKSIQMGILIEYSIPSMSAYKKYRTTDTPFSNFYAEHCINFPLHKKLEFNGVVEKSLA